MGSMTGDEVLRQALQGIEATRQRAEAEREEVAAYVRLKAPELAEMLRAFLRAMAAAGNPGLERPRRKSFFSPSAPLSWEEWIYPDGTATDTSLKPPTPIEEYAFNTLRRDPYRDEPLSTEDRRRQVDSEIRHVAARLARIMARHGVSM